MGVQLIYQDAKGAGVVKSFQHAEHAENTIRRLHRAARLERQSDLWEVGGVYWDYCANCGRSHWIWWIDRSDG